MELSLYIELQQYIVPSTLSYLGFDYNGCDDMNNDDDTLR